MPTDKSLWEGYTRGVKRVKKEKVGKQKEIPLPQREGVAVRNIQNLDNGRNSVVDCKSLERKREKSIRQGKIEIEAKLDLHGMTQSEAYSALANFMQRKTKEGKRNLLIITGVGREGQGVLRQNLKNWLSQLPESKSILAIREAAPNHGGKGAFYVLLRKKSAIVRKRELVARR